MLDDSRACALVALSGRDFVTKRRRVGLSACVVMLFFLSAPAMAATLTDGFQVSATVVAACNLSSWPMTLRPVMSREISCRPSQAPLQIMPPQPRVTVETSGITGGALIVMEF